MGVVEALIHVSNHSAAKAKYWGCLLDYILKIVDICLHHARQISCNLFLELRCPDGVGCLYLTSRPELDASNVGRIFDRSPKRFHLRNGSIHYLFNLLSLRVDTCDADETQLNQVLSDDV